MGELAQKTPSGELGRASVLELLPFHRLVALPASGSLCLFSGWLGGASLLASTRCWTCCLVGG